MRFLSVMKKFRRLCIERSRVSNDVNYYRTTFYNERNRDLVQYCRQNNLQAIANHLRDQDSLRPEKFADELFENRYGMQLIFEQIQPTKEQKLILDVACGNAELLKRLAKLGHHVVGIDLSEPRIASNVGELNNLLVSSMEAIPFSSNTFDIIIAQECLEHVINLDKSLRELHRVMKPGGIVFCQVPDGNFADGVNHVRLFDVELLRWVFEKVGFQVHSVENIPYLINERPLNLSLIGSKE